MKECLKQKQFFTANLVTLRLFCSSLIGMNLSEINHENSEGNIHYVSLDQMHLFAEISFALVQQCERFINLDQKENIKHKYLQ